jgi:hypothetical protein
VEFTFHNSYVILELVSSTLILWNVNSTPGIYVDIAVINYAKFMKCTKQKNVAASKIGLQFLYKKKLNKKYVNQ